MHTCIKTISVIHRRFDAPPKSCGNFCEIRFHTPFVEQCVKRICASSSYLEFVRVFSIVGVALLGKLTMEDFRKHINFCFQLGKPVVESFGPQLATGLKAAWYRLMVIPVQSSGTKPELVGFVRNAIQAYRLSATLYGYRMSDELNIVRIAFIIQD